MPTASAAAAPGPESDPVEPSAARPIAGDDSAIERVRRRTALAGVVPATCGAMLALAGWAWPGWLIGRTGAVVGGLTVALCLVAAAALLRRAYWWRQAESDATAWSTGRAAGVISALRAQPGPTGWVTGVCGAPAPLHRGRGSIPMFRRERRLPPVVLPLRTSAGPLAAGYAVVVHARTDRALPAPGDRLQVRVLAPRGPILIARLDDGVVFAADRWSFGPG